MKQEENISQKSKIVKKLPPNESVRQNSIANSVNSTE